MGGDGQHDNICPVKMESKEDENGEDMGYPTSSHEPGESSNLGQPSNPRPHTLEDVVEGVGDEEIGHPDEEVGDHEPPEDIGARDADLADEIEHGY